MTTREALLFAALRIGAVGYILGVLTLLYLTGWLLPLAGVVVLMTAIVIIYEQFREQRERDHDR